MLPKESSTIRFVSLSAIERSPKVSRVSFLPFSCFTASELTTSYCCAFSELRETIKTLLQPLVESSDLLDQESWLLETVVDSIQSIDGWEVRFLASGLLEIPEVEDPDLQRVMKGLGLGEKIEGALQVAWRKAVEVSSPLSGSRSFILQPQLTQYLYRFFSDCRRVRGPFLWT